MKLTHAILFCSLSAGLAQSQQTGGLTVQVGGRTVGTRGTLNLTNSSSAAPSGIVQSCTDNARENRLDCASVFNSALIATHDTVHSNENYCHSANGTSAYTCQMPFKSLTAYTIGMTVLLNADTACPASCTLNIDNLGALNLKRIDGTTDPGGALTAGQPQWIVYDGRVFRLMGAGSAAPATGPQDQRGDVIARRLIGSMDSMSYAAAITLQVTAGDLHKTTTMNSVGNATINAATAGLPGQHMWIIVENDRVSAKTVTFGANFRSAGAIQGTPGKATTIHFVSDGTAWYEVARTLNL